LDDLNCTLLIAFLKQQEGFSAKAYTDTSGNVTIGYGHVVTPLVSVDRALAESLLMHDIYEAERKAKAYVVEHYSFKDWEALSDKHKQALIELVFSVGSLTKFPKFTKALMEGDINMAIKESRRYYRGRDGKWVALRRRNVAFIETFLK